MKRLSMALGAAGVFALAGPALAQQQASPPTRPGSSQPADPGTREWVNTSVFTGTVTGIDRAQRRLMARDDSGRVVTLAVGPELPHFETLRQGDTVMLRYTEAEALALSKRTDPQQDVGDMRNRVEAAAAQAPGGADRGRAAPTTVVAQVADIDPGRGVLTLQGGDGAPLAILANPQALQQLARNDEIVISFRPPTAVEIQQPGTSGMAATAAGSRPGSRDASR